MIETAGPSRAEAQQRGDDIRTFRDELARLADEGILRLDAPQQAAIRTHHERLLAEFATLFDVDRDSRAKQLSLGMRVASFLGALALAASVFFLFYQFWGHFGESAQVVVLIASALATFGLTLWIQGRDATGYFTKLAALVAFAQLRPEHFDARSDLQHHAERQRPAAAISVGVAGVDLDSEKLLDALTRADAGLYAAKHAGRNRVVRATPPAAPA